MKQLKEFCLFAVSDMQLLFGAVVGVFLLWLGFRVLKGMAGMLIRFLVILLLVAVTVGIFFMLRAR